MATCDSYIDAAILVQLDAKLLVIACLKETFLLNDVLPKKKKIPSQFILRPCANLLVATLLHVTCCVRLHILLHVVGCCCTKFEIGQTFEPTTLNISFVP